MRDPIIVSLGGSIMVPENIDTTYIKQFRALLLKLAKRRDFILVTGGGMTARDYIHATQRIARIPSTAADRIGIAATRLNAELFKAVLGDRVHPTLIRDPSVRKRLRESIAVAGGWKPGTSSDGVAVRLAETYKAKTIVNLSNVNYIYDKDPAEPGAKRKERLTWSELQDIVGTKWVAGGNYPFDPTATKMARQLDLTLYCLHGRRLKEVAKALQQKPFKGTIVQGR